MNTILVWILVVTTSSSYSSATVIGQFRDQAACISAQNQIETQSKQIYAMPTLMGVCVQANVVKP